MKIQKLLDVVCAISKQNGVKKSWILFMVCFCALSLVVWKTSYGAETLQFGVFASPDYPWTEGIMDLKERVEQASGGEIKIEIVPRSDLGTSQELLFNVQKGEIDLALLSAFDLGETVDAMKIFRLPFLFQDKVQARIVTSGDIASMLLKETEKHGFIGLGFVPSEYNAIINTSRPIEKPEDFQGLKIATTLGPIQLEVLKALGATPVPINWDETFAALTEGVVSGAEGLPSSFYETKSYEVAKYMTVLPINYIPGIIVANAKTWTQMPSDQKKLIVDSIPVTVEAIDSELEFTSTSAIKEMEKYGMAVYSPEDMSAFRELVSPVFLFASNELSEPYREIAYSVAYCKEDLAVYSKPTGAAVFYCREGDEKYKEHNELTNTTIYGLEYAVWKIKVEKAGFHPKEETFDPYYRRDWRIDIELEPIK